MKTKLEKAADEYANIAGYKSEINAFKAGANWQSQQEEENKYTNEDMIQFCNYCVKLAYSQPFTDDTLYNLLKRWKKN